MSNSIFYEICSCGSQKENHRYRHPYNKIGLVEKKDDCFYINADIYPKIEVIRCGFQNCKAPENLHQNFSKTKKIDPMDYETAVIKHDYIPEKIMHRRINFVLPEKEKCIKCGAEIKNHSGHQFVVNIHIDNKKELDKVSIVDPYDEYNNEIKIIEKV